MRCGNWRYRTVTTNPSSSAQEARRALGGRLRDMRKDAGLSGRELAAVTGQHPTRVSKIENGAQAPTDHDIRRWCAACAADDQAPDLIATLRSVDSSYLEFRRQARAGMKRVLGAHTLQQYEQTKVFRIYEHNVIPGLFQTAEYSTAMLSFWTAFLGAPNDIEDAVAVRMERQRVIRRGGKRFVVVLEEQALRTWFGTAETQAGQLGRLLELLSRPNISLGIIPLMTERTAVGSTGFWIFDDTLVALETPTASIQVTQPQECTMYARMFEVLKGSAVYGRAARGLIVGILNELDSSIPSPEGHEPH
ncbi:helix-turn-helix domain-containing protein [Nocardia sp. NPDC057440]|uniref:helix-turn-helix domain-containing protein n=1 Tax=Nocardia sp. NPDC057440 TaxID=3346134 RepID=UPI0036711F2C